MMSAAAISASRAEAQSIATPTDVANTERTLVLEVWLNGMPRHATVEVHERGSELTVKNSDLGDIGILAANGVRATDGRIDITKIPDVTVTVNEAEQRLIVTGAQSRIAPRVVDLRPSIIDTPSATWGESEWGTIFDYDAVATLTDIGGLNDAQIGGYAGFTAFSPYGVLTTTSLGTYAPMGQSRFVRLETNLIVDDPESTTRWTVGDALSGALRWTRSVRYAGFQIASDFSLQPEVMTVPLPDVSGEAVVPSAVDVFVGSSRVYSGTVEPGPFRLDNLPVSAGGRDVRIAVRDALGRETIQTLNIYTTASMLAKGLSAYSAGLGFLRREYGNESFAYGGLIAETSYRYGLTDKVTLEAHAEGNADLVNFGGGGAFSVSSIGAVEFAGAMSTGDGTGYLGSISLETSLDPVGFFASAVWTTPSYGDLGSLNGDRPDAHRFVVGGNLNFGTYGVIGASFIDIGGRGDDNNSQLTIVTYSVSISDIATVGLTAFHDHSSGETSLEAHFSIPFNDFSQVSGSAHTDEHGQIYSAIYDSPMNPDGGFGYRLAGSAGRATYAEASAMWRGDELSVDGGVSVRDEGTSIRLGTSGALVNVDGSLFAARRTDGSFALVKSGQENVRVYHENREVARTDENGESLVSDLTPYLTNRISIDPSDFPMSTIVETTDAKVRPRRRSVAVVDLHPAAQHGFVVELRLPDNKAPDAGSLVTIGTLALVVGRDGELFVPDAKGTVRGVVQTASGNFRFELTAPPESETKGKIPHIGSIHCTTAETSS